MDEEKLIDTYVILHFILRMITEINSSLVIKLRICLERGQKVMEIAFHLRFDLHLINRWGRRNSYLMLWILPKFLSRNKNVVYPYLGKNGCDENDGAKGSGKVLDPDSPSALAALVTLIFMGTGLDWDVAAVCAADGWCCDQRIQGELVLFWV